MNLFKYIILFVFIIYFKFTNSTEASYSFKTKYAKTYKLNNGNIVIVGNIGILIYDSTELKLLYNYSYTLDNSTIIESKESYFTTFAQFSEEYNGIVIICVKHILYILNSDGEFKFNVKLTHNTKYIEFYTIVPYIYENNNYYFILGYINSHKKAFLQYCSFNINNKILRNITDYELCKSDYGLSCQIMNHNKYGNLLTCFYLSSYPVEIIASSFKIENNKIENILNSSYDDNSFSIQSEISSNREKAILCYIKNKDYNERNGYCAIYDINENKFEKYNRYLTKICEPTINHITLSYFKETKEYIFTCTDSANIQINFARFDQNFDIIPIVSNGEEKNNTFISIENCYSFVYYSFIFISNEYKLIGDFDCYSQKETALYSLPSEYKPLKIYNESSFNDITSNIDSIKYTYINNISSLLPNIKTIISSSSNLKKNNYSSFQKSTFLYDSSILNIKTDYPKLINYSSKYIYESIFSKTSNFNLNSSNVKDKIFNSTIITTNNLNYKIYSSTYTNTQNNKISIECNGYKNNDDTICSNIIPIGYYLSDKLNKIIEKCHINCQSCVKGSDKNNNNCLTCKDNFELKNSNCLYKYNYYFNNECEEIIYLLVNQLCPEKLPYEIIKTKECVESCTNEEFINKICKVNYYSENNINIITNKLKSIINETTNSSYDVIIDGNNIIYEITTTSVNNDHYNLSSIDFGECENILKRHYSIDYLLVFKIDIKLNDSYPTIIEYEVYSPVTKQKLDLSLCENNQINIYVPIYLDNYTNNLYNYMNQYGYDILNENNSFYNDICTTFSSDDGTDIILSDRRNDYYNKNITLCENGCTYIFYNNTNGKAKCQCQIKSEISDVKAISYDKMDIEAFLDFKTISNVDIIKCYKLTFSLEGLKNNYGSIIIIFFIVVFISLIIFYHVNEKSAISRLLRIALKTNEIKILNPPHRNKKMINIDKNIYIINDNNDKKSQTKSIQNLIDNHSLNMNKIKNKDFRKLNLQIKNYQNINVINKANIILKYNKKKKYRNIIKNNKNSKVNEFNIYHIKKRNKKQEIIEKEKHELKYNEEELNNLSYNEAILIDKRTYFQYYWSLLKKKHMFLFVFMSSKDYNLLSTKIGLLIFSFCLYFTVNAFFFTDKTMHKIYEDKGVFNFLYQLPQILYSTLISSVINIIIKYFALSEKSIINLKTIRNKLKAFEKSVELNRNLMIKFNLFYYISLLFLIFFWYYISTFCAVYKNTQIIFIKNTLSSFTLTLVYPFLLNLFPGIFRMSALKPKKKIRNVYINLQI